MSRGTNSYEETIQRMRKSINRLDNEIERSRLLTQDITIKNKTNQNISLIIKVQDQYDSFQSSRNESRVTLPQKGTYHHRISTSRERQNQQNQTNRYRPNYPLGSNTPKKYQTQRNQDKYHIYDSKISQFNDKESSSAVKVQRKFQPFAHLDASKSSTFFDRKIINEKNKKDWMESGVQTQEKQAFEKQNKYLQSQVSEGIDQESPINLVPTLPLNQQKRTHIKITQFNQIHLDDQEIIDNLKPVNLPVSMFSFSDKKDKNQQPPHTLANQSPQVMNYLKQKITDQHSDINTPNKPKQNDEINTNKKSEPSNKLPQRNSSQWRVQPLSISFQNNKKYFDIANQKTIFKKNKADERKNKFNSPSPDSRLKSNSKNSLNKNINTSRSKSKQGSFLSQFQMKQPPTDKKYKANDLFLQRKSHFLKKLEITRKLEIQTHRNKSNRSRLKTQNGTQVANPNTVKRQNKFVQMSSKAKQVSQRLYSRSKEKLKPCDYYQRHSQSIQRERFYDIVRQNSFVGKYVSRQQQETLFQSFRRLDDSVSTWPMKIVNYTYSKLQKINVSRYTIKKTLP